MYHQCIDLVLSNANAAPRLREGNEPYGITALLWANGIHGLCLLVDHRGGNPGCSVTTGASMLVYFIHNAVFEPRAIPWQNTRWVERDSAGRFDHLHINEWEDMRYPRIEFAPCGQRDIDSFKNYAKSMGFMVDSRIAERMQALFLQIDTTPFKRTA